MITIRSEYVGIELKKLNNFEVRLQKIEETNPELAKELLAKFEDMCIFNIPIIRSGNGIDFELETDTGHLVGRGKFLDCLKTIDIVSMDYNLSEEIPDEDVKESTEKLDLLAGLDIDKRSSIGRIHFERDLKL